MSAPSKGDDPARRRTLALLALATVIGSAGLAAGGTAGALLGAEITGTEAAAGLPLGMLVVGQAIAAILVSGTTGRVGRGPSLALGYVLGAIGAVCVIVAATEESFALLLAGSAILGAGNTAVFLTRYAAAEVGGDAMRGRALGVVLFAAAAGAVASPNLLGPGGELAGLLGLPPLAGIYVISILCFSVAAALLAVLSIPGLPYFGRGAALLGVREGRSWVGQRGNFLTLVNQPTRLALALLAAVNLVMVSVMAMAPVHLASHGHGLGIVGIVVAIHVAGMFVPSPISGWGADSIGPTPVAAAGFALLVVAGITGAVFDMGGVLSMTAMLLMLGIGWNLGMVGASTLLAASAPPEIRPNVEGLGEVSMGLAAGAGAPLAGLVVTLGGFASLTLVGAVAAMCALALLYRAYRTA